MTSIVANRYVFPASTLGYARGGTAGMVPKTHLTTYKVLVTLDGIRDGAPMVVKAEGLSIVISGNFSSSI
ncbi:hypothetical protein L6452_34219 [Arctium lappa]|uniref:Uncharacterized protein n=1 Tax=Arctium lappa TaxID=4217 RepID=A0ACB8YGV8_ARCLA|nr:hypothetical protein L6452_34219 [Arctium lappa]